MKFPTLLPDADSRGERLARVRVDDCEAKFTGGFAKIDAIKADRLTSSRLEVHTNQCRCALMIFGVHEPAAVGAHARPIFIRLAERDLPRISQRMFQRNVPEIVVVDPAVGDDVSAATFAIP